MVTIVKHEWHQVDSQFAYELDENTLSEIYPDMDEDEISTMLKQIEDGEIDVEDIINDAWDNEVEIEWDRQYDDWWTERKGGYESTYEVGDEDSWHHTPEPDPTYYNCTKCRWEGGKYSTLTQHLREDDALIENYYQSEEESHHTKEVCPMCDSEVKFTEFGEKQEKEWAEREARWAKEESDDMEDRLEELKQEFDKLVADEDGEEKK